MPSTPSRGSVALVTLGCTRNEVDSEELAGRLSAEGWTLVDDAADADVAVVNTCGFVEQAKKDSIDTLLEAADLKESAAPGGRRRRLPGGALRPDLADELPDADAVLGFDSYRDMSSHAAPILAGERHASHVPSDRRRLLPLSPVDPLRRAADAVACCPVTGTVGTSCAAARGRAVGAAEDRERLRPPLLLLRHPDVPRLLRVPPPHRRPRRGPVAGRAGVKRAVPRQRELDVLRQGPRRPRPAREAPARADARMPGIERVRVSYLQPAEVRPGLLEAMADTPGVMPWYDLSFQHASPTVLRRMRRFGGTEPFLDLIGRIRDRQPDAGVRSNVIVGFPGETEEDVEELERFLAGPTRCRRCLRLLRRGRHRGRVLGGKLDPSTSSWSGSSGSPASSRSSRRSARASGSGSG
jgi:ribosomal protein S12 methylthiotransferase